MLVHSSEDVFFYHGEEVDFVLDELVLSLEQGQLEDAGGLHDGGLDLLHELDPSDHGASRGVGGGRVAGGAEKGAVAPRQQAFHTGYKG